MRKSRFSEEQIIGVLKPIFDSWGRRGGLKAAAFLG